MGFDRQFAFLIGVPILIAIEILRYKKSKKYNNKFLNCREILIIIFSIYIIGLVSVTLLPFYIFHARNNFELTVNYIPVLNTVKDISEIPIDMESFMIKFWIVNIFGNLFLLVPLSIIVPMIFKKFRSIKATVVLCLLVSVSIESMQYLSMFLGNPRSVDIDDIILNTLGSIIGFGIYKVCINNSHKISEFNLILSRNFKKM